MSEATCVDKVINNGTNTQECSFLHDGLKLYFTNNMPGGYGGHDIWVTSRETQDAPWKETINLGPTVNSGSPCYPAISPDELELYFHTSWNSTVLMRSTRVSKDEPWGPPTLFTGLGSSACDLDISADGLTVYFDSDRSGGYGSWDIWLATRETVDAPWGEPVNLGPNVNDSRSQSSPSISNDGLVLFFNNGSLHEISVSRRATKDAPWSPPVLLGSAVNGGNWQHGAEISPDGSVLYFDSGRAGGLNNENFWQVRFTPIVDFNGDRKVDIADLQIMVDHWGENYSLCDIGPTPFGDGIVDLKDLAVLTEHFYEDYRLVANWTLDEETGDIAHDCIAGNDGTCHGGPVWAPSAGNVGGALVFTGAEDYISTPFILDPAKGEFSVFAWIYGGAPGQVIISQADTSGTRGTVPGSMWLGISPSGGKLTTGLSDMYFGTLESETIVTDIQWHHVGLVYDLDSLHRRLYVDGVQVAEDTTVVAGVPSDGVLHIGAAQDLGPASFFVGMIDDVRIYNVALSDEEVEALAK